MLHIAYQGGIESAVDGLSMWSILFYDSVLLNVMYEKSEYENSY